MARFILLVLACFGICFVAGEHCNKKLCASVVSKCQLTQACKCEINREAGQCDCCHNCTQCLGSDYALCCSCLGLCEPTTEMVLNTQTQVGKIKDPFHQLFAQLTAEPDDKDRWTSYTYPISQDLYVNSVKIDVVSSDGKPMDETCSVMYMSQCMSVTKCHDNCSKNGAAYFRYFYDGCCECVGLTCLNYGINESRCAQCTQPDEEDAQDGP